LIETRHIEIDGHRIVYRVAGSGPPLVALYPHRGPDRDPRPGLLADRWQVFQIDPLGFGASDRPHAWPASRFHEQVVAIMDRHGVDRFPVWGYSRGGAMAAAVAHATPRVSALICGGFSLVHHSITEAFLRRIDREQRISLLSRDLWRSFHQVDWSGALSAMPFPKLIYIGGDDTSQRRRMAANLELIGVDVLCFDSLDHGGCERSHDVVEAVAEWLSRKLAR
jgi:pimeloyl-ACP methyl ester carboxylesterase